MRGGYKMTKVNWFDNHHNWVGYFIINALNQNKSPKKKFDGNNLDVKFTVDGFEFDFISVVEHLGKVFEDSVLEKAKELHEEKLKLDTFNNLNEISYLADRLQEELNDKLQEVYNSY